MENPVRTIPFQLGGALAALALAGGCATLGAGAGQGFDGKPKQADDKLPTASRFFDDAERALIEEAQDRQLAARRANEEGNVDKAREDFAAAADRYARFADRFPASEWRLPFRYKAAEFFHYAQQDDRAAEQAEKVLGDADASDATRAMAAQLDAIAWRAVVGQRVKAGALEPLKLLTLPQRAGSPLAARALPEPRQRFVAAVDAWLKVWEKHPDVAKPAGARGLALPPWEAALVAAQVEYHYDDMPEAVRRLDAILQAWPGEPEVVGPAAMLLLEAQLVVGDAAGFSTAKGKVKELLDAQLPKAQEPKARETLTHARDQVALLEAESDFRGAQRLLEGGNPTAAAEAFEKFAVDHATSVDAPNALFNAAIAWDKAGDAARAGAAREALLARHGDSKLAPMAALFLAGAASKRGDHEAAARGYASYLERWPEAPNRCIAMQNAGYELDVLNRKVEAAERYLAFGTDARCAKERPNEVAKLLYRGGQIFIDAKQRPRAKDAFDAAVRVEGVTDPTAQRQIEDAKRQIKRL
jgi:TolA-binding protein